MTFKTGDKVKVTFEGTVKRVNGYEVCVELPDGDDYYVCTSHDGTAIEKVVRPFQVGDRVRATWGTEWILGRDGYMIVVHPSNKDYEGTFYRYPNGRLDHAFESREHLELVS